MRWIDSGLLLLLAAATLFACSPLRQSGGETGERDGTVRQPGTAPYAAQFLQAPSDPVHALQLYPQGTPFAPPVLNLEGGNPLVLEFDVLGNSARQFRVRITHRNRQWERSPLTPYEYMDGFHEATFGGGRPGLGGPPSYYHYRMLLTSGENPGDAGGGGGRMGRLQVSGNFLLEVFAAGSGERLFSLPFLVSENDGELVTETETLFTSSARGNVRSTRLLSDYRYPPEVTMPQFDLHAAWVPDRHWGRIGTSDFRDSSVPGLVRFQQERSSAYPNTYYRRKLSLRISSYAADIEQIREVVRDSIPHRVVLRRDTQNFPERPPRGTEPNPAYGLPASPRSAGYYRVAFSLEPGGEGFRVTRTAETDASSTRIYVAGSFNGWGLEPEHRMRYDESEGLWETEVLIKEGEYHYSYLMEKADGSVHALGPISSAGEAPHEIMSMVYYRDPGRNYDRLLQVRQR